MDSPQLAGCEYANSTRGLTFNVTCALKLSADNLRKSQFRTCTEAHNLLPAANSAALSTAGMDDLRLGGVGRGTRLIVDLLGYYRRGE